MMRLLVLLAACVLHIPYALARTVPPNPLPALPANCELSDLMEDLGASGLAFGTRAPSCSERASDLGAADTLMMRKFNVVNDYSLEIEFYATDAFLQAHPRLGIGIRFDETRGEPIPERWAGFFIPYEVLAVRHNIGPGPIRRFVYNTAGLPFTGQYKIYFGIIAGIGPGPNELQLTEHGMYRAENWKVYLGEANVVSTDGVTVNVNHPHKYGKLKAVDWSHYGVSCYPLPLPNPLCNM